MLQLNVRVRSYARQSVESLNRDSVHRLATAALLGFESAEKHVTRYVRLLTDVAIFNRLPDDFVIQPACDRADVRKIAILAVLGRHCDDASSSRSGGSAASVAVLSLIHI